MSKFYIKPFLTLCLFFLIVPLLAQVRVDIHSVWHSVNYKFDIDGYQQTNGSSASGWVAFYNDKNYTIEVKFRVVNERGTAPTTTVRLAPQQRYSWYSGSVNPIYRLLRITDFVPTRSTTQSRVSINDIWYSANTKFDIDGYEMTGQSNATGWVAFYNNKNYAVEIRFRVVNERGTSQTVSLKLEQEQRLSWYSGNSLAIYRLLSIND